MLRLLILTKYLCSSVKYSYRFQYGSAIVPHPEKAYKGGEDAVFTSSNVLLVADGVGGWADSGVDPALYSKKLAKIIEQLVKKDQQKYINDPKLLIKDAVQLNKQTGSTTACLLTLHPTTGLLKAYYLGDSVYGIINTTQKTIRIAEDQQYSFNFPVQIGTNGANPLDGIYHQYKAEEVLPQQLIVIATDGIWDNLKAHMIYECVVQEQSLDKMASNMAQFAKKIAMLPSFESPFYLKAKAQGINFPKQGKLDDNSVILARIIRQIL